MIKYLVIAFFAPMICFGANPKCLLTGPQWTTINECLRKVHSLDVMFLIDGGGNLFAVSASGKGLDVYAPNAKIEIPGDERNCHVMPKGGELPNTLGVAQELVKGKKNLDLPQALKKCMASMPPECTKSLDTISANAPAAQKGGSKVEAGSAP